MIKTCEICAGEFGASRSNQRYCPDCGKNPDRARKQLSKALYVSRQNAGDYAKPRAFTCAVCGKESISAVYRTYCSNACAEHHRAATATCSACGANLASKGNMTGRGYCSDACRERARLDAAIASGNYVPCKHCGRNFIVKHTGNKFCKMDCYRAWVGSNRAEKRDTRVRAIPRPKICARCGKRFEASGAGQRYCSPKCRTEKPAKHAKPQGHLCTTCRTPQMDCERFTSNFVYHPKGAVQKKVGGKLIVVSCPKFR